MLFSFIYSRSVQLHKRLYPGRSEIVGRPYVIGGSWRLGVLRIGWTRHCTGSALVFIKGLGNGPEEGPAHVLDQLTNAHFALEVQMSAMRHAVVTRRQGCQPGKFHSNVGN